MILPSFIPSLTYRSESLTCVILLLAEEQVTFHARRVNWQNLSPGFVWRISLFLLLLLRDNFIQNSRLVVSFFLNTLSISLQPDVSGKMN